MSVTAMTEIASLVGTNVEEGTASKCVLIAVRGGARERRRIGRMLQVSVRAKYLSVPDDEVWLRSALIAARELEAGNPVVIEVTKQLPMRLQQFLRDLRFLGAIEVVYPTAQRTTTIRCRPMAGIVILGPLEVTTGVEPKTVEVFDRALKL